MKTFRYCNVKCTPRVPLILPTFEKNEREYFDFVLLLSSFLVCSSFFFFFSFFSLTHNSKVYNIHEWSAYQTTALLSESMLLLTLLSMDRTTPTNAVYLNVVEDVFYFPEFNEVNISAHRPSSEPLISCRYTTVIHVPYLYRTNLSTIHLITLLSNK